MKIKPPGSGKPFFESFNGKGAAKKGNETFVTGKKRTDSPASVGPLSQEAPGASLSAISAGLRPSDLKDPEKVKTLIRSSIEQILEKEFPATEKISEAQREFLTDWMANDPTLRSKVLSYWERALK